MSDCFELHKEDSPETYSSSSADVNLNFFARFDGSLLNAIFCNLWFKGA